MSSISSPNENALSHRQGSVTSLLDEDEQNTFSTDPSMPRRRQKISSPRLSSSSSSNGHSKLPHPDDSQTFNVENEYQIANIDLQTVTDTSHEDNTIPNWKQLSGEIATNDQRYQNTSQSDSTDDITTSLGFQQQENNYQLNENSSEEIDSTVDYETIVRSKRLYFDPNPDLIRKPQMITPILYKQNIMIKFLKPPAVPQGPLIIREVRPPQPPPPPPLIIRQRPPVPLSPPPIILREQPPPVPVIMTAQVLTKTLPPVPPPPRSVIIERLPPLPPRPRDIIIERWIPYESTTHKRKVIVQRAEEPKPHPPSKNVIITYDKVEARIVRQFQRGGIAPEDPEKYSARYGNSLLNTQQLLAQAKELGITEDISVPNLIDQELQEQSTINLLDQNFSYENSVEQKKLEKRFSNGSSSTDRSGHGDIDHNNYAPTYENLVTGVLSSMNFDQFNEYPINRENDQDLTTQLAQYGLTKESIPY